MTMALQVLSPGPMPWNASAAQRTWQPLKIAAVSRAHCSLRNSLVLLQVMKQLPVFRKLVQEAADGNDENEDIAKGLARVFAEVAEAYVSLISAGKRPPTPKLPPAMHPKAVMAVARWAGM